MEKYPNDVGKNGMICLASSMSKRIWYTLSVIMISYTVLCYIFINFLLCISTVKNTYTNAASKLFGSEEKDVI